MKIYYLRLTAFACDACNGPVIAGSFATRETEIQRETDIQDIGLVCLSYRKQYISLPTTRPIRHMSPLEWDSRAPVPKQRVSAREQGSVVEDYIQ